MLTCTPTLTWGLLLKRSFGFPRTLVFTSMPFAMAGLLSCAASKTMTADLGSDGGAPCLVDDMVIPTNQEGICFASNGSSMVCPAHACAPTDCPAGCTYEPLV